MFLAEIQPRHPRAAALLALAGALAAGPAFAEQSDKGNVAPPITAPMTLPTQQQAQAQPPQVLATKPEPGQPGWLKICNKDQGGNDLCSTTRDFVSESGKPLMAVALYEMRSGQTKEEARVVRFLVPLGFMIQSGIRFTIDGRQATTGKFNACLSIGCFSEATIGTDVLAAMKKGASLKLAVMSQTQREVNFVVPLEGLGAALEGPAMTVEEQKKYQAEVARRAEEARKRQEAEKTGAAPAADTAAPASEAAPKP
ncbi:invasion associated locus B family protein [Methylobacterium durans]|uniref:Invasion-associated locus B family protein n=1 Tax=Methylobacterium durans TaxID=2202825 RepID=A0A2U8W155_9HYPH|nr:invasion associated locus B family protein [Methylobacterium durans]AWN39371.1 invasion-associated locus B family protein [Methylobacterium durans]